MTTPSWYGLLTAAIKTLMDSPRILCAVFLLFVAIPLVINTANGFNSYQFENRIQQNANTISQDVGERIGVINTVLASLVGLHDVSDDLDDAKLLRFSADVLENASYVENLGSFERVPAAQRKRFETRMSHNGYSDFSIAQINDDGRFVPRLTTDTYFPVSVTGPLHVNAQFLLGADLGTLPGFSQALMKLNTLNTGTIRPLPETWPLTGDLMFMRAVFADQLNTDATKEGSTSSQEAPTSHYAGGFWLTIDINRLFEGLSDVINEFDVNIQLINDNESTTIYSAVSKHSRSVFLTSLFPKKTVERTWSISTSTGLVVTLEQAVGLSAGTLIITSVSIFLVVLISCLYTSYVMSRRQTEIDRREGLQDLFKEREKAEKTLNSMQDAIFTLDPELVIVHVNPAAVTQFNTRASLAIGQPLSHLVQFHRLTDTTRVINIGAELASLSHNSLKEFDVLPAGHCDEDFIFRMSLSSSHNHDGKVSGHVLVLRDISHEQRLTKKLAYQANYDSLTGCTNRYFFEQSLDRLIDEMPVTGLNHTLCYIDLDQFKIINDTCGHRAGDQLLIELTKSMQLLTRDQDVLSRLGGDEFGLILVGLDKAQAMAVSERIYQFFQSFNFTHQGNAFSITASIGVVHIDSQCANSKDIMAAADIACYAAKDSGRNSISVFSKSDEGMAERSEELHWLPRLQTALKNNEFRLHVQAVASLDGDTDHPPITHFEFLLRLANEDGSEVTPWQFIQAAERYDLMRDIDRWVIRNSLQAVAEHSSGPGADCSFSINLSGQSAADPSLKLFIQEQMALHRVDPCKIWFELTETAAISHFSIAVDLINNIRTTGAKVALDDFGSGLSSFGYLKNLPVDIIKIDGQFVKEIVKNPIDREMVRAIHGVGESMNIKTVAEFVEDQDIVDELKRIGVNYAQGYHIGKPMPILQAMALLTDDRKAA